MHNLDVDVLPNPACDNCQCEDAEHSIDQARITSPMSPRTRVSKFNPSRYKPLPFEQESKAETTAGHLFSLKSPRIPVLNQPGYIGSRRWHPHTYPVYRWQFKTQPVYPVINGYTVTPTNHPNTHIPLIKLQPFDHTHQDIYTQTFNSVWDLVRGQSSHNCGPREECGQMCEQDAADYTRDVMALIHKIQVPTVTIQPNPASAV